jgi:hypothetical protein
VALHIGERAGELTFERAAVGEFGQRIDVGACFERGELPARRRKLLFETFDLNRQQRHVGALGAPRGLRTFRRHTLPPLRHLRALARRLGCGF